MKVLVSGAAGFIGSHTAEHLLRRGDDVVGVDSVNEYYNPAIKEGTIKYLESLNGKEGYGVFKFIRLDMRDPAAMRAVFEEHTFDVVCHLAAQAGVRHSIDHAVENVEINILATVILLELSQKYRVPHNVFASSSSVYGVDSTAPFSEDQFCAAPISPYAATKRSCELFAHTYHHLHKMSITMLRFFTVYGPRGRPDMACLKFIDMISKGKPIPKYGDGSAVREFTYIDDIVNGVVASIDRPRGFQILNLGGGSTHTLNEFIACIEKHVGKEAVINHMPDQPGDVPLTSADQTRAKEILDFVPKWSMDEGIKSTVAWYKEFQPEL